MKISPYLDQDFDEYSIFAKKEFGGNPQQSSKNYIQWLYKDNPYARDDYENFLVAKDEKKQIIGFIHKTILPWKIDGKKVMIATLHDLMMSPDYRDGSGVIVLMRSFKNEFACIVPGAVGDLRLGYLRLGHKEIQSYWFRRILNPLKLLQTLVTSKLGLNAHYSWLKSNFTTQYKELTATSSPSTEQLIQLAGKLKEQDECEPYLDWNVELLKWRYFSERGPKHLLIEDTNNNFSIISFGLRHGVPVARILEISNKCSPTFLKNVLTLSRKVGACMIMGYSTKKSYKVALAQIDWQPLINSPSSILINKNKKIQPGFSFSAAATDMGFEAIER